MSVSKIDLNSRRREIELEEAVKVLNVAVDNDVSHLYYRLCLLALQILELLALCLKLREHHVALRLGGRRYRQQHRVLVAVAQDGHHLEQRGERMLLTSKSGNDSRALVVIGQEPVG